MSRVVCDASIIASFLLIDEWTSRVPMVANALRDAELWAPVHLPIEIGSLLVTAQRRGRITRGERLACLEDSRQFIATLDDISSGPSNIITDLAIEANLSAYDAAYLELAIRRNALLATNDRKLLAAAGAYGLTSLTTLP